MALDPYSDPNRIADEAARNGVGLSDDQADQMGQLRASNYGGSAGQSYNEQHRLGADAGQYQQGAGEGWGQSNQARGSQQDALGLMRSAAYGNAPSVAAQQQQQGLDAAMRNQQSMAAGARGPGGLAMAQYGAGQNMANMQQAGVGQAAMLRAQEMAQARGQYTDASNAMRGQDIQGAMGQGQMALGYEGLNQNIGMANLQAQARERALEKQQWAQQSQLDANSTNALMNTVASGAKGGAALLSTTSDVGAKQNISPMGMNQSLPSASQSVGYSAMPPPSANMSTQPAVAPQHLEMPMGGQGLSPYATQSNGVPLPVSAYSGPIHMQQDPRSSMRAQTIDYNPSNIRVAQDYGIGAQFRDSGTNPEVKPNPGDENAAEMMPRASKEKGTETVSKTSAQKDNEDKDAADKARRERMDAVGAIGDSFQPRQMAQIGGGGFNLGDITGGGYHPAMTSDKNQKSGLNPVHAEPADMLDRLQPYSYDYKEGRGLPPGRKYGIMAQDLEQTPMGSSAVHDTPRGKMIDLKDATGLHFAAEANLNQRLRKLEGK